MPSSWLPSRRVVSKTSTRRVSCGCDSASRGEPPMTTCLSDMFDPVLVAVDLAPDGGEVRLLDGAGDGPGFTDLPVVDRADGHDLCRRAREERLLAGVQLVPEDVPDLDLVPEVAPD